jgi:hypothetical protein
MCDQVIVLLSPKYSASIVWNNEDSDTESVDMDTGDTDRLFTFEVSKRNEQEESAVARPGFKVLILVVVEFSFLIRPKIHLRYILRNMTPPDRSIDPAVLVPRLLLGETTLGILTAAYIPRHVHKDVFNPSRQLFNRVSLRQLL